MKPALIGSTALILTSAALLSVLLSYALTPPAVAHPHTPSNPSKIEAPTVKTSDHKASKRNIKTGDKEKGNVKKSWPYFGESSEDAASHVTPDKHETSDRNVRHVEKIRLKPDSYTDETHAQDPGDIEDLETHFNRHADKLRIKIKRAERQHDKAMKRFNREFDIEAKDLTDAKTMREAAKGLETLLAESGIISNFAEILADFADDIEIEENKNGLVLKFDGKTLGKIQMENNDNDHFELEGLGRNLTIDKQVITENGKTKTRIIIEMDGSDEVDVQIKP